jgi:ABC-type transport system substrate-binding protein
MGVCKVAGSYLSPRLPESEQVAYRYDPGEAERLLDRAGFRRPGPGGMRFELRYRTTPVREGLETALMIQDLLSRVGIRIVLEVVEPAVFISAIRKGKYQLSASTWAGIADGSILYRTLRTGQPDNRAAYHNDRMDRLLDQASSEPDAGRRIPLLREVQRLMGRELPYFPLWYWDNMAIVRKGWEGLDSGGLSISGSYEPLTRLKPAP